MSDISMRDKAVALAERGFKVIKLGVGSKLPVAPGWPEAATSDPSRVHELWTCPVTGESLHNNIGIATGDGLLVIDVDVKKNKAGDESLQKLINDGLITLDRRYVVRTASGGKHVYGSIPPDLRISGRIEFMLGIDLRAHHGYVVAAGSEINGVEYIAERHGDPWLRLGDELVRMLPRATERVASPSIVPQGAELDSESAIARARDYLEHEAPEAVEGNAGDQTTCGVARRVRDFGVSEDTCLELMLDHWNSEKAFPPWFPDDLARKIENAYRYAKGAIGNASAEFQFSEVEMDEGEKPKPKRGVSLDDFVSFMETHTYIFKPTRAFWPAGSVNARIKPIKLLGPDGKPLTNKRGEEMTQTAAAWLDAHRHVEQMTWCPGLPMLIRDKLVSDGGWIDWPGVTIFNLYRPPVIKQGDASAAGPWIELVHRVFPDDAEHLLWWFAHRVQRPDEKINHGIVLGGDQGIGKDTILEPVKRAVGQWNFQEVSPPQLLGRFNGFLKSVILRVSEARDLGEMNRYQFYEHMKPFMAAPPDTLRVDEKHAREYSIVNCTGVIITTNHKTDGIFLPPDDRRHYVAWSPRVRGDIQDGDWKRLWTWYGDGGDRHVASYLGTLDLSGFNPKAPPPKTQAFWDVVGANQAPESAEFRDVLDRLEWPEAVTLDVITEAAAAAMSADDVDFREIIEWAKDKKNRRIIPHRMGECGYVPVRNDTAKDGYWKIKGKRRPVYARKELSPSAMIAAARKL